MYETLNGQKPPELPTDLATQVYTLLRINEKVSKAAGPEKAIEHAEAALALASEIVDVIIRWGEDYRGFLEAVADDIARAYDDPEPMSW